MRIRSTHLAINLKLTFDAIFVSMWCYSCLELEFSIIADPDSVYGMRRGNAGNVIKMVIKTKLNFFKRTLPMHSKRFEHIWRCA